MTRRRQSESPRTTRTPPGAPSDADGRTLDHRYDSKPRPQTVVEWLVWLTLWPIVTIAWLVAVPFVLIYVAVGSMMEALFRIRLRRHDDSDGTDPAG